MNEFTMSTKDGRRTVLTHQGNGLWRVEISGRIKAAARPIKEYAAGEVTHVVELEDGQLLGLRPHQVEQLQAIEEKWQKDNTKPTKYVFVEVDTGGFGKDPLETLYREHFGSVPSITETAWPSVAVAESEVGGFIAHARQRGYTARVA